MAKMRNEHLSPAAREWLLKVGLSDRIIRFSKKKLLSSKEWDKLEGWLRQPGTPQELARLKALDSEKAACLCYLIHKADGESISVSPLLLENTINWKTTLAKVQDLSK